MPCLRAVMRQGPLGPFLPGQEHLWAVHCIAVEEVGNMADRGETPRAFTWDSWGRSAQMGSQRPHELVIKVLVHQLQQGPDRALRNPGITIVLG